MSVLLGSLPAPGFLQATKRITRGASKRIAEYACNLALARQAARGSPCTVTAVHKNNVVKQTDGLFLEVYALQLFFGIISHAFSAPCHSTRAVRCVLASANLPTGS